MARIGTVIPSRKSTEDIDRERNKALIEQAKTFMRARIKKLRFAMLNGKCKGWSDWAAFDVPSLHQLPYTADNIAKALACAVDNAALMNQTALATAKQHNEELGTETYKSRDIALGGFTMRRQQKRAYNRFITDCVESERVGCNLIPLRPGRGKSVICGAVMVDVINRYKNTTYFGMPWHIVGARIIYITPAPVVEKTRRTLVKCGIPAEWIGGFGHPITLIGPEELSTIEGRKWFEEYTVNEFDNAVKRYRWKQLPPNLIIVDEAHKFKKIKVKKSRYIAAFLDCPVRIPWLFTTATPAVDAENCWLYTITSGIKWRGKPITLGNIKEVLSTVIGPGQELVGTEPDGMAELKTFLEPIFNHPPEDPATSKAQTVLEEIPLPRDNPKLLAVYEEALRRWFEAKERAQEDVSQAGAQMAQFTILTQASELMMVNYWADKAVEAINNGLSFVCGVKYQEPLRQLALKILEAGEQGRINIPGFGREHISVIFGGEKVIHEKNVYKPHEWAALRIRQNQWAALPEEEQATSTLKLSTKERTKLKNTQTFYTRQLKLDLTSEEVDAQNQLLLKYKLDKQSKKRRQEEIDNFQEGRSVVCLFTLASGGTGLDLDKQLPNVRDRVMYSTICYYAEEFGQALGRCVRLATLQPVVKQYMTFFLGTIMSKHVRPILQRKLRNLSKFSLSDVDLAAELAARTTVKDLQMDASVVAMRPAVIEDESGFTGNDDDGWGEDDEEEGESEGD